MKKHDYAISLTRFIAMVLILSCHTCEWIGDTLGQSKALGILGNYCAVGVQLFLVISGYLYGSRKDLFEQQSRIGFLCKNMKKILIDYYVYVLLVIIPVYFFLSPGTINAQAVWGMLTCSGTLWGVHHLWYIPYILAAYLLTPILYDLKKYFIKGRQELLRKRLLLFGIMILLEIIGIAYHSYFIMAWINAYVIGFFLPDLRSEMSQRRQVLLTAVIFVFSAVLNVCKLHVRYEVLPLHQTGIKYELCNYFINYSRVLFALAIFCMVVLIGERLFGKVKSVHRLLDVSDKYSYDIYIVHMIYVKGILSLLNITQNYFVNIVVMLGATMLSAWILYKICNWLKRGKR